MMTPPEGRGGTVYIGHTHHIDGTEHLPVSETYALELRLVALENEVTKLRSTLTNAIDILVAVRLGHSGDPGTLQRLMRQVMELKA